MTERREHDLVLFGATGFVGALTAEYLARVAPDGLRIALAGRSAAKLEAVRAGLPDAARSWPVVVADSGDEAQLDALAASTRVVLTTVGPYARLGLPLVGACARAGTHYADLTGEVLFMRAAIDAWDATARESGARIVHTAGFDSIPSDLGVLALHEAVAAAGAGELGDTELVVVATKGGFSGGTIDSLRGQLDVVRADRDQRRIALDPYGLSPDREAEPDLGPQHDPRSVTRGADGRWRAPFLMSTINTRVVRRSNALLGHAYGRAFRYQEYLSGGRGPRGAVTAGVVTGGLGALMAGLAFGPTRKLLDRVLPDPGEGPSEELRRRGFFRIELTTTTTSGRRFRCRVSAQGDPGYQATAEMLGETGLALALDEERLPDRAGVLTPATAVGTVLTDRLRAVGHVYDVTEES
jgi:short subunit dehydrogenase-like uncharacterized protein